MKRPTAISKITDQLIMFIMVQIPGYFLPVALVIFLVFGDYFGNYPKLISALAAMVIVYLVFSIISMREKKPATVSIPRRQSGEQIIDNKISVRIPEPVVNKNRESPYIYQPKPEPKPAPKPAPKAQPVKKQKAWLPKEEYEAQKKAFYYSRAWLDLRYKALIKNDGRCECCGRSKKDGIKLHVDHIKPRSKFPELELVLSNLQVLCEDCNRGKSNIDDTDWR